MDALKNKSEFNFYAASVLIENNYYAPSVHCSYYSMLQYVKHVLTNKFHILEQDYEKGKGSHEAIKNKTVEMLSIHSTDKEAKSVFVTKFGLLQGMRIDSDYKDVEIDILKAQKSLRISEEIKKILQKL